MLMDKDLSPDNEDSVQLVESLRDGQERLEKFPDNLAGTQHRSLVTARATRSTRASSFQFQEHLKGHVHPDT